MFLCAGRIAELFRSLAWNIIILKTWECWSITGLGMVSLSQSDTFFFSRLPSRKSPLPNFVNTLLGMTWFGHGEVEKTSTRFSFHISNPQNPASGFICVWTKTRWNIWTTLLVIHKLRNKRPKMLPAFPTAESPVCFGKMDWREREKNITVVLCAIEAAHTPLWPYVHSEPLFYKVFLDEE